MFTSRVTSGLTVQRKYQNDSFPSSYSKSESVLIRPHVDGFDKGITQTSDPHSIENGRPKYELPISINYRDIFGRGLTANEKQYYLESGLNRIDRLMLNRPRGRPLKKSKRLRLSDQEIQLQLLSDIEQFTLARELNPKYRDQSNTSSTGASSARSRSMSVISEDLPAPINPRIAQFLNDLALTLGDTNIDKMDILPSSRSSSLVSLEMMPTLEKALSSFGPENSGYMSLRTSFSGPSMNIPPPPPPPSASNPSEKLVSRVIETMKTRSEKSNSPSDRSNASFDAELRNAVLKRALSDASGIEESVKSARIDQALKRKAEEISKPNVLSELKRKVKKIE